jgi:hypothetical protein
MSLLNMQFSQGVAHEQLISSIVCVFWGVGIMSSFFLGDFFQNPCILSFTVAFLSYLVPFSFHPLLVFLWNFYGFSNGISMMFLWNFPGTSMECLSTFSGISMDFCGIFYGTPWSFFGNPMGFL